MAIAKILLGTCLFNIFTQRHNGYAILAVLLKLSMELQKNMTYKISIVSAALLAAVTVAVLGAPQSALAVEGEPTKTTETTERPEMSETTHNHTEMSETQKRSVAEKRAAAEKRIATIKENVREKLATKRLEVCEKRQAKINDIARRGATQNTKQLAVFQKIEAKVMQFATNKNITGEAIDAALAVANEKEAAAVAAIEVSQSTTFDCATTDGANPGSAIKQAMTSRHSALKEYRTAVKNLIVAVKQANNETKSTDAATDTTTTEER